VKKIIHLIPFDAPGGVETAALSAPHIQEAAFDFQLQVLFPGELNRALRRRSFNPVVYVAAALRLAAEAPDILIVSLWRGAIVGVLCKLLRPRTKLVVFLHLAKRVHFADKWATRVAMSLATEVWSDSRATMEATFPRLPRNRSRVISYLPRKFRPVTSACPGPAFVFWGRLARQKNLQRAIKIFTEVRGQFGAARFLVIGPDGGELSALRQRCRTLGVHDAVVFLGPKSQDELPDFARQASFFLLTSEFEGMGLVVVEAMQMGLVPVVTRVGEVGEYCRDGVNAVVIDRDEQAAAEIVAAIQAPELFKRLRANAIAAWSDKPSYRDDLLANCRRLLVLNTP